MLDAMQQSCTPSNFVVNSCDSKKKMADWSVERVFCLIDVPGKSGLYNTKTKQQECM